MQLRIPQNGETIRNADPSYTPLVTFTIVFVHLPSLIPHTHTLVFSKVLHYLKIIIPKQCFDPSSSFAWKLANPLFCYQLGSAAQLTVSK